MTTDGQLPDQPGGDAQATIAWPFVADAGCWDSLCDAPSPGTPATVATHDEWPASEPWPVSRGAAKWPEGDSEPDPHLDEVGVVPVLIRLPDLTKLPPEVPKPSPHHSAHPESDSSVGSPGQPHQPGQQNEAMSAGRTSRSDAHPESPKPRGTSQGPPSLPRATVRGDVPPIEAIVRRRPLNRRRATIIAAMCGLMIVTAVVIVHHRGGLGPAGGGASRKVQPAAGDSAARDGADSVRRLPLPVQHTSPGNDTGDPTRVRTAERSTYSSGENTSMPRASQVPRTHDEMPSGVYPHTDPNTYLYPTGDPPARQESGRAGFLDGARQSTEPQTRGREAGVASLRGVIETVPFGVQR